MKNAEIEKYMTVRLDGTLPPSPSFVEGIRRAPRREANLSEGERATALKNALRYIPEEYHKQLAPEFLRELDEHGKIYGYRYRPEGRIYGKPIDEYKGNCVEGKAF
ncbi:MAG: urocanate hydratase, partial [Clostridiaceae bacterium]|nr:urocanate hydratase [Clostridiaceae bacterium]